MCLIIFSWQPEKPYPFILAANRDEFYNRPTKPVHQWEDYPDITGGRDLQCQGSWLAVNRQGKFATVTNFREIPLPKSRHSRGRLVTDFLSGAETAMAYLERVRSQSQHYAGFNLLVGDNTGIFYYSNRRQKVQRLRPGVYGLSNHLLDTPWPKLQKVKNGLSRLLERYDANPPVMELLAIMGDENRPVDADLPDSGVGLDRERLLSSCFIKSEEYGTRNTSILKWSSDGRLGWHEQLFLAQGLKGKSYELTVTKNG